MRDKKRIKEILKGMAESPEGIYDESTMEDFDESRKESHQFRLLHDEGLIAFEGDSRFRRIRITSKVYDFLRKKGG